MTDASHAGTGAVALTLSDELLRASQRALNAGLYEMAYHTLAGALHGAESVGDGVRLRAIQEEAGRQQDVIDAEAPEHRLSRGGGRRHGHAGWYDALALQAKSAVLVARAASAVERVETQRDTARQLRRALRDSQDG
jgi:hypothetical protein